MTTMMMDMALTPQQQQLIEGLNSEQKQAVQYPNGPLLILAGAGSGKTRVLTRKIAYQLSQGVEPPSILAVTFTNKASKEMKLRIQDIVGETLAKGLWVGTFHSVCGKILRRDITQYQTETGRRWTQNFVIYDETESMAAVKAAIAEQNLDPKLYIPKTIRYMISDLKNNMIDAYQYASQAKDFRAENLALIYDAYESIMVRNNALDFDDLLMITVKLLQSQPKVLDTYHDQFKHVLVDEFQDTNNTQYELIRLIVEGVSPQHRTKDNIEALFEGRSLTVVGDVDQSIYSWRGANFKICLNFQADYPNATLIKLLKNYRSTETILNVANEIIENNTNRLPKDLIAVHGKGEPVVCHESKDEVDEAHFVVSQLRKLTKSGEHKAGDCAVLYRTNMQSRVLEDLLIAKGIPYTMIGGLKFYERREIKDVLAYLTVIFNDADSYSLKRVMNVPKRGLGKTTIQHLEAFASHHNISLFASLKQLEAVPGLKPKAIKTLGQFAELIESLKEKSLALPLDELLLEIMESSGYYAALKLDDPTDSDGRVGNVEELVNVVRQFMTHNPDEGLPEFLTQMSLLSDLDSAEPAENKLVLMTLHAAKGLEYPVVFMVGLEEGLFPHGRSLNDKDGMEEERRLMYVGVTRAEKRLFFSFARRRMVFGETKYAVPSRFLNEAPQNLMTGMYSLDSEGQSDAYVRTSSSGISIRERRENQSQGGNNGATYGADGQRQPARRPAQKESDSLTRKNSSRPKTLTDLGQGDRVQHQRFGMGTIVQVIPSGEKRLYNVQFDSIDNKKLLDPRYVKLEKL